MAPHLGANDELPPPDIAGHLAHRRPALRQRLLLAADHDVLVRGAAPLPPLQMQIKRSGYCWYKRSNPRARDVLSPHLRTRERRELELGLPIGLPRRREPLR